MVKQISIPDLPETKRKVYSCLAGIDLSSLPSLVSSNRSPDALNVWKNYASTAGKAIETRPGYKVVANLTDKIYGIHGFKKKIYVHYGTKLALLTSSGISSEYTTLLSANNSASFEFDDYLYILDGTYYWRFDGENIEKIDEGIAYIPTTRIGADPNGGNGTVYQGINMLSPYRKNTFVGNGTDTTFYLDDTGFESATATVDGVSASVMIDSSQGTVSFETAPSGPANDGEANVEITYKMPSCNADIIAKCNIAVIFDQRVFVSGNDDKNGYMWHSELSDPTYFADDNYYHDGNDDCPITGLCVGNNMLLVVKGTYGSGEKVFYHTPTLDYEYGKVYPYSSAGINVGGYKACVFKDETVYLSNQGLESISLSSTQYANARLYHKSSLIDQKFTYDISSFSDMCVWKGYLCILCADKMYLADSRQKHTDFGTLEYEWYLWDNLKVDTDNADRLFVCEDDLYFATKDNICIFEGTNDNGKVINSYWTTPRDTFGYPAYLKTVNKKGGVCIVKPIPNSTFKISCNTSRETNSFLAEFNTSGFTFENFTFNDFSFATNNTDMRFFKVKKKKINWFTLKFYSDEKDKPFGLYEAVIEYIVTKFAKESN